MNRKKVISLLASFLVLMLLFTILSRAADSAGIANVKTETIQSMGIDHRVTGSGKVAQNREQAIATEPNQTVKGIYVNEGYSVNKGDLLFEMDLEKLKEQILLKKQEIEKMNLQEGDNKSKSAVENEKKENAKNRAEEDINNAQNKGDNGISKAADDLQNAQQKLDNYRQKMGSQPSVDDTVLAELQKVCEEKEASYQKAQEDQTTLERKIEREVNKALDEAEKKNQEILAESEATEAPETESNQNIQEVPFELTSSLEKETEDLQKVEKAIRDKFKPELDKAKEAVALAQEARDSANGAVLQYQQEQGAKQEEGATEQEQQLLDDITAKQQAYNDAVTARDESVLAARRVMEDAQTPEGRDSTNKINKLDKEKLQMELKKMEQLQKEKGQIKSPISGVITKIAITTGDKTTDGTAILMADTSTGAKFQAQVSAEQEKFIAKNDVVNIKPANNGTDLEGLKVDSVKPNEENKEMLDVTVLLPKDSLEIGTAAEFEVVRSSKTYSACIPIQALHVENNENFIYVLMESDSVLGKETKAQKVLVKVLDKNEKYAALEDGSVTNDQNIITESDKSISAGSRVRLMEE